MPAKVGLFIEHHSSNRAAGYLKTGDKLLKITNSPITYKRSDGFSGCLPNCVFAEFTRTDSSVGTIADVAFWKNGQDSEEDKDKDTDTGKEPQDSETDSSPTQEDRGPFLNLKNKLKIKINFKKYLSREKFIEKLRQTS